MIFTKVAVAGGVVLLGFLCFLAAKGMGLAAEGLITVFALFVLIAGGNLLSGRGAHGAPRPAVPPARAPVATSTREAASPGAPPGASTQDTADSAEHGPA